MLATARTFSLFGVEADEVVAEVDVNSGLPSFSIVGLPDAAVRESRERVRAAIVNSGFDFPMQRITANLAPADIRKAGPGFDLAIAAALLGASEQLPEALLARFWLAGELALDGAIRAVPGVLAMAERAVRAGAGGIIVPEANAVEAELVPDAQTVPLRTLGELRLLARGEIPKRRTAVPPPDPAPRRHPDIADLRGQGWVRHGLEVAVAGGHSLMLLGPPGAGKSLAARCVPSLLPELTPAEAIEVARIASASGRPVPRGGPRLRPYRAPHHTISPAGLVGGGTPLRPGEVTLAHRGVLFLDELPEFSRSALEALRQPLEDGRVTIARSRYRAELPSRFMLIAAANPCPCGRGEESPRCSCGPESLRRYRAKLSGALADRIDIMLRISQPSAEAMDGEAGEGSEAVAARVTEARHRQAERLGAGRCNAGMRPSEGRRHARLGPDARAALRSGHEQLALSGRGWDRVLRVARTVADLAGSEAVEAGHVAEALSLRGGEAEGR